MSNIIIRPDWHIPESEVTPERVYQNRRTFLQEAGFLGAAALMSQALTGNAASKRSPYPAKRNGNYSPPWRLTDEDLATTYNNFYEFTTRKTGVVDLVDNFQTSPWSLKIDGLCENPRSVSVDDLIQECGLEERVYRFRCVEAWGMTVPWTGFPMHKIIRAAKPKPEAKFVKFVTALKRDEMPGVQRLAGYPWPYTEGLTVKEAMHDLSFVATGIYGKPMPKQNGAPIRTVIPWKYGYKSIKSIVSIEFTKEQPKTLWETLAPDEYPFESNVEPQIPHPRWSQATHRVLGSNERVRTLPYNGYAKQVAKLYGK